MVLPQREFRRVCFLYSPMSYKFIETSKPSDKCRVSHVTTVTYVTHKNSFELHGILKSQNVIRDIQMN